jgi:hypothetical protein
MRTNHQDDVLSGKDITDMVARLVVATEREQRERKKADSEGGGLEASIHQGLTQTGGLKKPEEWQILQPVTQLKSMAMQKMKPKPNPGPISMPNPELTPGYIVTLIMRGTLVAQ